jgi:hypothetical protein
MSTKAITAGALALILAYFCAQAILGAGLVDDAYIFMRYAENFVSGEGMVFNPGERVEGYTSPLWLFTTCLLALLPFDLPGASWALSSLLGLSTVLMVFVWGATRAASGGVATSLVCALFLATNPAFVYWTASGMDTSLIGFLVLAAFLTFASRIGGQGSMLIPGISFALATLTRPEMIALLPAFLLFIGKGPRKWLQFLAPLALPALHILWRWYYYGALLPNTYDAKVGAPLWSRLHAGGIYSARFALAFSPVLVLLVLKAAFTARNNEARRAFMLATAGVAIWALSVTALGGDHFSMLRFYVPLLPLFAWLMVFPGSTSPAGRRPSRKIAPALPLIGMAAILGIQNVSVQILFGGKTARDEVGLALAWADVGRWLQRNLPPGATIASEVVGAIPYYSRLRTLDLFGLTDREVAMKGKTDLEGAVGHQRYHTDYVLARRPEFIIFRSSGWSQSDRPPGFSRSYDYPLLDLANDSRTASLYNFTSVKMDNGKYIYCFKLKAGAP